VAGAYGIYQYFTLPKWDALWMVHLGNASFGLPRPMELRVFSIMNAPQILALFLSVGILLALHSKGKTRFIAAPVGALALVLTSARTAWVSFLVGLVYLVLKARSRLRMQILLVGTASLVLFGITLQDPRVALAVSQRMGTLSDVGSDDSFVVRMEGYQALFASIADYPFGLGLGGQANGNDVNEHSIGTGGKAVMQGDSALAAVIISLGGCGTLLAAVSFLLLVSACFRLKGTPGSPPEAVKMLTLVLSAELLFNNIVNGPGGFLAWSILAMCLASASTPTDRTVVLSAL
jgi:hypothetical protein